MFENTRTPGFLRQKVFVFLNENGRMIGRFFLTALFIIMAAWFVSHQRTELKSVSNALYGANKYLVLAGLLLVVVYILSQGLMYVTSFASMNIRLSPGRAVILFLKRNFISVFLPAGAVSSLAFFNNGIEKDGYTKSQVYFASAIYAFTGILSVVIIAIPAFIFIAGGNADNSRWYALGGVILLLLLIAFIYYSFLGESKLYHKLIKLYPKAELFLDGLKNNSINTRQFIYTFLISLFIDLVGIAHVYIAIAALGLHATFSVAVIAYIVGVIFLIISPFLRGLGAIELSVSLVLIKMGFNSVDAIAVTLLFRLFEFWLPLVAGVISFLLKIDKLLMRIIPAVLIFSLGILNIISVLTPALPERLAILKDYILTDLVTLSNSFVLMAGLFLLVTAAFMLKGLRTAWWFALTLSIISVFGHITKGIDYEEASVAFLIIVSLFATKKEYHVRTNPRLGTLGFQTALLSMGAVLIYGVTGFYFLDKKHFQIDFNLGQSFVYTVKNYFLIGSADLVPRDAFARGFINLIRISGFASISFLIYSLVRPYVYSETPTEEEYAKADIMVKKYGNSAVDYFKTYSDKLFYTPEGINAMISYRVSKNYAVVLENPVAENDEEMKKCIASFRRYSYDNGLRDVYYRVPKESLPVFSEFSMKSLFIGQEGVIDLQTFSLEGGEKKSIRNALNKIRDKGYKCTISQPPLRDGFIQKLRAVSDEWLKMTEREEILFSQGMFSEKEIKKQVIISVENSEEKIVAFLNIIPDYVQNEGTYDLLRKTSDAPNGIMDFLLVELMNYFRSNGIRYLNVGFAPLSGLDDPHNFTEKSMKFAYEKIKSFSHYKGQREYKEKFNPVWYDKYLVYSNDYDLLQIPGVLGRVFRS
jgi:phosphatidylglycerol lysyltransferase